MTLVQHSICPDGKPNRWVAHDLGMAVENLTVQALSMDMYVHNMAGFSEDMARELFQLPESIEPMTMIAIGYLGDPSTLDDFNRNREEILQVRRPLEEMFLLP